MEKKMTPKPLRTALVVLGMHRSGTSALAGVLAKVGADLPQDLMGPAEHNAKGFFESNKVVSLNDELLASAGQKAFTYDPVPPNWFASPKAIEFEERAVEILLEDYGRSHLFVLKDPRMCRLLPFWQQALKRAGCRPLHVCVHRHPLDVAASLNCLAAYETDYAVHLWLRHVLEAEVASRGQSRVFTSYQRLMTDCVEVVTNIGTRLNLEWPRSPQSAAPDMAAFLSKDLQHFRDLDEPVGRSATLPDWVAETLDVLETWTSAGEREDDYQILDRIRATIEKTGPILGPVLWHNQKKRWKIKDLSDELEEIEDAVRTARQEAAKHAKNHATEQKMRGAAEARITELGHALEATQAKVEALQTGHITEKERYRVLVASHDALETKHDALAKKIEQITCERDQLRSQLEQGHAEAEDLHRQTVLYTRNAAELEELLTQRSRDVEERFREIARVSEILLESQIQADTQQKEIEQLKIQERLAHHRIEELEASTSWRVTGPLRRVVTFLRR